MIAGARVLGEHDSVSRGVVDLARLDGGAQLNRAEAVDRFRGGQPDEILEVEFPLP